jgi:hypothetical protein
MIDHMDFGIDAPSTCDPAGAIQTVPCGSVYLSSLSKVIDLPSGSQRVSGNPL